MKTSLISTAKSIFTLIALCIFSMAAQASVSGTWINEDNATRNITKVIIKNNNTVQVFGSCSPKDCDWGTASLQYKGQTRIGKQYIAKYDQGFAKRILTFYKQPNGKLRLQAGYTYTDSRPAQKHTEYFVQKDCGGYQGIVVDSDNRNLKLAGAKIKFVSEDVSIVRHTTSTPNGSYQITLPQGRYRVKATLNGYQTYVSQGFFVVNCQGTQSGDIYMTKKPEPVCTGGYAGIVLDDSNRNIKLSGVKIKFVSEDVSIVRHATSSSNGGYKIAPLPKGRYRVKATLNGYETYMSQGFFVVSCQGMQTGNIFMKKKTTTSSGDRSGLTTLKEDCVNFNPKNLSVKQSGSKYLLVDGKHSIKAFTNKSEAYKALKIIQHYGINQSCFVGRPNPSFTYLLANGKAPMGNVSGDDCISFNPKTITLKKVSGSWKIVDGSHWMFDFGTNQAEAKQAFQIIKKYGFTQSCFVGRPNPSLQYMIK